MPTQQPKAAIAAIEDPLLKVYAKAWQDILDAQEQIAADPMKWRQRKRLTQLQKAVEDAMDELDVQARQWATSELVRPYAMGAAAGAVELGESAAAVWTMLPKDAISRMATDTLSDLLKATRHVRRTTKTLIRAIARDEILGKLTQGRTAVQAGRRMEKILAQKGISAITYKDGSRHGLREYTQMLVRTKTGEAYNLGTLEGQEALGVTFWECFDGPDCGLTRHSDPRRALGRLVDKETALAYPLSHPNAIMEGSQVQTIGGLRAVYRAAWSGPVYQVRTATGSRLTIGSNHPVLTARGWLRAELLREGDQVVRRSGEGQIPAVSTDMDLDQMPASVADAFAAVHQTGSHSRVVATSDYLHGDGEFCQGEVDVVSVEDHRLPPVGQAHGIQALSQAELVSTAQDHGALSRSGTQGLGLWGVDLSATGGVRGGDIGGVAGTWTNFDSSLAEAVTDCSAGAPELLAQMLRCSTSEVLLDEVVEVRFLESWIGHAYDLETGTGVYWCDGVLVHNCRRSWGARPDIKTKGEAEAATPSVAPSQIEAQRAADADRTRLQTARRYRERARKAPKAAVRRAVPAGDTLTAAKRGDAAVPTRIRPRR